MTERELRKKIVEITISTVWKDSYGDEVVIDRVAAEQLADALIKANVGDVEWKHRAEVAERAARDLIAYYCSYTIQKDIDNSLRIALLQAEKELQEEKKSD